MSEIVSGVIVVLLTTIIAGLGWVILQVISQGTRLAVLEARNNSIEKQFTDLKAWLQRIEDKLDALRVKSA